MLFRSVSQSRYIRVGLGSGSAFYSLVSSTQIPSATASSDIKPLVFPGSAIPANTPITARISDLNSQFTVLALRQAEALQRWKEISQSGDSDYREQIRKHFGVNLPQALSNMCTYIGGISRNLDISEVVNSNLAFDKHRHHHIEHNHLHNHYNYSCMALLLLHFFRTIASHLFCVGL